ncbi:hypothetical protein K9M79_07090 [Candidatus Woesearchaeota archaeon]|nr:hypothetical protein [Candidatus Woesearchaeota archaeon]
MDTVVLVNSNPFASKKDLGCLERIVRKNHRSIDFGYVKVARALLSDDIDYIPVVGRNYHGEHSNLIHVITGVPLKTPYSLINEDQVSRILRQYSWVNKQPGVYGICMGLQILASLKGKPITRLTNQQVFNKYTLWNKWDKWKKSKVRTCHRDGIACRSLDELDSYRFNILASRRTADNYIIYKFADWYMGHIGVQYHPELNKCGRVEFIRDIRYLMENYASSLTDSRRPENYLRYMKRAI